MLASQPPGATMTPLMLLSQTPWDMTTRSDLAARLTLEAFPFLLLSPILPHLCAFVLLFTYLHAYIIMAANACFHSVLCLSVLPLLLLQRKMPCSLMHASPLLVTPSILPLMPLLSHLMVSRAQDIQSGHGYSPVSSADAMAAGFCCLHHSQDGTVQPCGQEDFSSGDYA